MGKEIIDQIRPNKAFIANTGIITAIGNNTESNLNALLNSRTGIKPLKYLDTIHALPAGEVSYSNAELGDMADVTGRQHAELPRTALLSIIAAREAWLPFKDRSTGFRVGFISANTVGGMDLTASFYQAYRDTGRMLSGDLIKNHDSGKQTRLTMDALRLHCWHTTISTACSSSANSIMMGARLIEQGHFDIVIAGGADSLSSFTLNGFKALLILDKEACRPFNEDRQGLNLGEGAAYLVLANQKALKHWGIHADVFVSGFANANDAHHQTASSPEGKGNRMAMEAALKKAGLEPAGIDYINLHGTGTLNNDSSEGLAIQDIFSQGVPPASSTKTLTGHTLGAAGAVEAVYAYLSIQYGKIWPQLRYEKPMKTLNWQAHQQLSDRKICHVLSNSFGFGGNCSTLVFSKYQY